MQSLYGGMGDEDKALALLETTCFLDLCGLITLPQLLDVYHNIPDIAVWRRYKFNLRQMWADWKAKQKPEQPARRKADHRPPADLVPPNSLAGLTPGQQRKEYEKTYRRVEMDGQKICRLEAENISLRAQNESLKEEIRSLRSRILETLGAA